MPLGQWVAVMGIKTVDRRGIGKRRARNAGRSAVEEKATAALRRSEELKHSLPHDPACLQP